MSLSRHETLKPAKGHTQWLKWKIRGDGTPFSAWAPKFQRGQLWGHGSSYADASEYSMLYLPFFSQSVLLFDKVASVYFIWRIYLYFIIGNGQPREPALCQLHRHTFIPCRPTRPITRKDSSSVAQMTCKRHQFYTILTSVVTQYYY